MRSRSGTIETHLPLHKRINHDVIYIRSFSSFSNVRLINHSVTNWLGCSMMYTFHSDPGHGWLQVNRLELMDLGILDKISHYSYQYGGDVYLEEDGDLNCFMNEMKARGRPVEIIQIYSRHHDSIIRSYEGFTS